jgi:hypothetical protein
MTPSKIPLKDLRLLWPRGDGAVLFLSYLITASLNGNIPRFTDKWFANNRQKHTGTIARWRDRWETMGVLKTKRRGQATHYVIDWVALNLAIREARRLDDLAKTEARSRAIAARVARDAQIAEELRQQCLTADPVTQHLADLQPDSCQPLQETKEKEFFVLKDSEGNFYKNQESHHPSPDPEPKSNPKPAKQSDPEVESNETSKNSLKNNSQENAIPAAQRTWFLDAAKRLIINSGKAWNKTLQTALEALNTTQLINLVSAFWEQTLRGNVQDAPKWLCKAAQKVANGQSYRPTRKFHLPKQLPQPPAAEILTPPKHSTLPTWLPTWAIPNVEALLQRVGSFTWIDEINDGGGIRVNWANGHQDFLNPRGAFA